ncbi:MAG TPA: hypothetical protein VH877_08855 [Polyangia bacterium]|nr:hypothetical protein [Polyangia bacterium]
MRSGFLEIGRLHGIPVRLHWSLPLGMLLFSRGRFEPGLWLGIFFIVLLHELGHALVVRYHRLQALAIEIHTLGGLCHWQGQASPLARAAIAWGGVWAQLVLLGATLLFVTFVGSPRSAFGQDLAYAFIASNAFIAALNLIPVAPFDGAEAWPLFKLLYHRWRDRRAQPKRRNFMLVPRLPEREEELPPEDLKRLRDQIERIRRQATKKGRPGS